MAYIPLKLFLQALPSHFTTIRSHCYLFLLQRKTRSRTRTPPQVGLPSFATMVFVSKTSKLDFEATVSCVTIIGILLVARSTPLCSPVPTRVYAATASHPPKSKLWLPPPLNSNASRSSSNNNHLGKFHPGSIFLVFVSHQLGELLLQKFLPWPTLVPYQLELNPPPSWAVKVKVAASAGSRCRLVSGS